MHFPWARVTSVPELVDSPQLEERSFWVEAEHPRSGKKYKYPGAPCKLSRSPWRVGSRVSGLGEDNRVIYREELGLSEEQIRSLVKEDVI